MVNIVLVEPRTSGNVGTIGRTVVAVGGVLHLIRPYGWGDDISKKEVKKAGLDYWDKLQWYQYDSLEDFWAKNPISNRHFLATTKTNKYYSYNANCFCGFSIHFFMSFPVPLDLD